MKYALPLLLSAAASLAAADLVTDVQQLINRQDFTRASAAIRNYEATRGQTPESILALSWMARGALILKDYARADSIAKDVYQRATAQLTKRPLDREPDLPTALGAAIEVQAEVLALKGQRDVAVTYLNDQLRKFAATSINTRIQKNINLLSMEGKPAPPLKGVVLPPGKPALIFFWAHWCPDCRAEAPVLATLKSEFGSKGLVFIGPTQKYGYVAGGEDAPPPVENRYIEAVRKQLYSAVIPAPAVINEENFLRYGVSTTPTLTLVDRHGIVRLYHPGAMKYWDLRAAIEALLRIP